MQWNELAWTDIDGIGYRLSAQSDGRFALQVGNETIRIKDTQALMALYEAIGLIQQTETPIIPVSPAQKPLSRSAHAAATHIDSGFPTKVRNVVLIMALVAVVILAIDAFRLSL